MATNKLQRIYFEGQRNASIQSNQGASLKNVLVEAFSLTEPMREREREENEESDLDVFVRRVYLASRSSGGRYPTRFECWYIYLSRTMNGMHRERARERDSEMISKVKSSRETAKEVSRVGTCGSFQTRTRTRTRPGMGRLRVWNFEKFRVSGRVRVQKKYFHRVRVRAGSTVPFSSDPVLLLSEIGA